MCRSIFTILFLGVISFTLAQTNAPSIQTGVTFQWADTQTHQNDPATIESITVGGNVYLNFGVPSGYEMTQLGPNGHGTNKIRLNGSRIENSSSSATWDTNALAAFQSLNLNNYFEANGNGDNICNDFTAEETTDAQRQTLIYDGGIVASSSGIIAVTERNANNCLHIEFFGFLEGSLTEQSLGETFVNQTSSQFGFGGTGTGGPNGLGTPGAVSPPPAGTDYWLSDRVIENKGTIGIALFYLDDIAPSGSIITKATITAATNDNGDGKLFILTFPDNDKDGLSDVDDVDDDNDGILDVDESNGQDPSADNDVDGIPNYQDSDYCTLSVNGICQNLDFDSDGIPNHLDLDTDNDGITDNFESQSTKNYVLPSGTVNKTGSYLGLWNNYGTGITPVDTDYDGVADYLDDDSDNDGLTDIQENGQVNSVSGIDKDKDGLDDNFDEDIVFYDVNDKITTGSLTDIISVYGDSDYDAYSTGDIDFRDLFDVNPPANALLDFDGLNDYLTGDSILEGLDNFTIMAWVKIDPTNNGNTATIVGEEYGARLYVSEGNKLMFCVRTSQGLTHVVNGTNINYNEWHHITGTYSNQSGKLAIFIDGEKVSEIQSSDILGEVIQSSNNWNGKFEVGRLSAYLANMEYFPGAIDEVRVFDINLTDEQIQQMVYQEIEDNNNLVQGKVIPKPIKDTKTLQTINWSNLLAYYPMTDIKTNYTSDISDNGLRLNLMNIQTVQEQTAPLPYATNADGSWTNQTTWQHGDVWDIENITNNKDWSIVEIRNNVSTSSSHTNLGLIIESDKTFTVNGDNKIENTNYLELNGSLDLSNDSQLIQTENSDLVTSINGKILRRQEGNSSVYWYNYWGSPIGNLGTSALTDNNATTNTNNSDYNLGMLKKPNGTAFEFTGALHETGKISVYWLYTYKNGVTYNDWDSMDANTLIQPGIGYTAKGTGVGSEQQYLFEGKPNNGTIVIPVIDTGGYGSVPATSKTDYLLGNPYPSALDIHKFIDDNAGVIDGTIQLWQQWSGSSHILDEYNGGYAQVNKTGATRAYQFVGIEGENNGSQDGTKVPTRYLPVAQGFMVEILTDGNVEFNNSQRVFIKESDADGSYENGSIFFRNTSNANNSNQDDAESAESGMQKIRLEFNSVDGPATKRELLLGFSEDTTDDFDYGYDAKNTEVYNDDLNTILGTENYTIQAYSTINLEKEVPLRLLASGPYNYTISITEIENISEDQEVYLKDAFTDVYHDLRNDGAYEFLSEAGEFDNRLSIVFQTQAETLSQIDEEISDLKFYYASGRKKVVVLNPNHRDIHKLEVVNMLGQSVVAVDSLGDYGYIEKELQNLSIGTYVISLTLDDGNKISKKIIAN